MAKFRTPRPEWVTAQSYRVTDLSLLADLYSVSDCVQNRFEHFIDDWQDGEVEPKNDYRLYDSPDMIRQPADTHGVDLTNSQLFFYEVYEQKRRRDGRTATHPNPRAPINRTYALPTRRPTPRKPPSARESTGRA
jgi:hypothetical protein